MLNLLRYLIDNFFGAWTNSEYSAGSSDTS